MYPIMCYCVHVCELTDINLIIFKHSFAIYKIRVSYFLLSVKLLSSSLDCCYEVFLMSVSLF